MGILTSLPLNRTKVKAKLGLPGGPPVQSLSEAALGINPAFVPQSNPAPLANAPMHALSGGGMATHASYTPQFNPGIQSPFPSALSSPSVPQAPAAPPAGYGFSDLAGYEEARRRQLGGASEQSVLGYGQQVGQMGEALRNRVQGNQAQVPGFFNQQQNALTGDAQNLQNQFQQNYQGGVGRLSSEGSSLQNQLKANQDARQQSIGDYVSQYGSRATDRRNQLASTLANLGQQQFSLANPGILEDLNRRGLASSPNAVANEQGQFLKEIALQNQRDILGRESSDIANEERLRELGLQQGLTGENSDVAKDIFNRSQGLSTDLLQRQAGGAQDLFNQRQSISQGLINRQLGGVDELSQLDKDAFGRDVDIRGTALSSRIQGEQDALDAGLDLRRGELEARMQDSQAAREEALARELGKDQNRNNLNTSLIGAGGNLLGGLLGGGGGGGGLGGLLGGGGGGLSGLLTGSGQAGTFSGVGTGQFVPGIGQVGTGALPAAGIGLGGGLAIGGAGLGAMALSNMGEQVGGTAGGILANPIGYQLNKAKEIIQNPKEAVSNIGSSISKSIKKLCFDAMTPVKMKDGSEKLIKDIDLGDDTQGGAVYSIRTSLTDDGTLYDYLGITVTGSHAVREHGNWIRVEDSPYAKAMPGSSIVYALGTSDHRIYVKDAVFGDEDETDDYEYLTIDESLALMNGQDAVTEVASNGS